jgi:hypothetical protein
MKRSVFAVAIAATALALGASLDAQKTTTVHPGKAGSPHVRTEWTIDGANVSIEYGRPSLKGRVPGKDIDPYEGREWRTGADEATTLKTALHHPDRRHLAPGHQQEDRPVGRPLSEGRGPRPRADDGWQGASRRRAAHLHGAGHSGRRHAPHRLGHHPGVHSFHGRLKGSGSGGSGSSSGSPR